MSTPFKMKGSPMKRNFGIGADAPMKEIDNRIDYTGVAIDPTRAYDYKSAKIPSFRDIISLEQQQDYAKKVDERRAKRKEEKAEQAEIERKQRVEEFAETLPETKTINEPEIEDPLQKYVVNQPLNVPMVNVKTDKA